MRRVPFLRRAHTRRWGVQSEVSHFRHEDERSVNGESPARWHRLPSLIPTNTLNRQSWRFAHRRPEPVSAFCGAGRASAGRDRRDGGVFYWGKAKIRSHICRFRVRKVCLYHTTFLWKTVPLPRIRVGCSRWWSASVERHHSSSPILHGTGRHLTLTIWWHRLKH